MHTDSLVSRLPTALSVNLNKVALVRNTRHLGIPSVVRAAELCLQAGARGITVHPRPDQRHIRPQDVLDLGALLRDWPDREFNIEGNPFHNLMEVARDVRERGLPLQQLTLVPDSEGQFTSDHGWRFPEDAARLATVIVGADRVELYTEPFAAAWHGPDRGHQLERYRLTALAAIEAGLGVNAGHDLNRENLTGFLQVVPSVSEVSIGHALIADALELGYAATVVDYNHCIARAFA